MPRPCKDQWQRRAVALPFSASVSFSGDALVLGRGTILRTLGGDGSKAVSLRADAAHDRMVALLAVAGNGRVATHALLQLEAALGDWQRGDHALAAIRLAFAPLPRVWDQEDAYRLFLAETVLDAGLSPRELVEELRYATCTPLLKFDPNQPRVPSGSGRESGRWTSHGGGGATQSQPTTVEQTSLKPTLVFQPPEPDESDVQSIEEDERRFGLPDPDAERSGYRLHFPEIPLGMPSSPPGPARAPLLSPAPGSNPVPLPKPAPGGGDPPSDGERDDKGPACPAAQGDRPRGRNPNGDEFEYYMSLRINPNDPTPKYSAATPDVTSQSYYLPSPTPDGKTTFDDCKKDDTPTTLNIPNLRAGDMFEMKASGWSGLLSNSNTSGYRTFGEQVKNQSDAVLAEGRGRQVYYCMGDQAAADQAVKGFKKYPNTHFLVCH